jgi:hypothetical protein
MAGGSETLEGKAGTCRSLKELEAAGQVWGLQDFTRRPDPRVPRLRFFLVAGCCWDMRMVWVEN